MKRSLLFLLIRLVIFLAAAASHRPKWEYAQYSFNRDRNEKTAHFRWITPNENITSSEGTVLEF